jgi:hypothetical protein
VAIAAGRDDRARRRTPRGPAFSIWPPPAHASPASGSDPPASGSSPEPTPPGISMFTAPTMRIHVGASDDTAATAERLQFTVAQVRMAACWARSSAKETSPPPGSMR